MRPRLKRGQPLAHYHKAPWGPPGPISAHPPYPGPSKRWALGDPPQDQVHELNTAPGFNHCSVCSVLGEENFRVPLMWAGIKSSYRAPRLSASFRQFPELHHVKSLGCCPSKITEPLLDLLPSITGLIETLGPWGSPTPSLAEEVMLDVSPSASHWKAT